MITLHEACAGLDVVIGFETNPEALMVAAEKAPHVVQVHMLYMLSCRETCAYLNVKVTAVSHLHRSTQCLNNKHIICDL